MIRNNYAGFAKSSLAKAVLGASIVLPAVAHADFISDSKASVELRNFYFNRDFRTSTPAQQNKQEEWGQGFIAKFESGYTEGTIGVGVDAIGALGLKLDSSPDRTGTGLLPKTADGSAPDDFSKGGATAKLRYEKNVLKAGTLMPKLPVIVPNDSRLLPQLFVGTGFNSTQIDGLNFDAGRLNQTNRRDSSNYEEMTVTTGGKKNITTTKGLTTNEFDYAGATYNWTKNFSTGYHYGELNDFYKQHYLTLGWTLPIADGQSLKTDLRWAKSTDDGGSNVDNKALNGMVTYNLGYHAFGLGYQKMSGDTGFAYINGTDPFLVNYVQILDFANKDERSYQARYDYNFAGLGIPGLTFMTRYVKGDNVDRLTTNDEGTEWERDTDIAYVFQDGYLKGLGVKWRNATTRSNFANNSAASNAADENRLIVSYTMPLW
ncbi:OprD family porin [Pseudomonas sp. QL9]|uniref:Porin n=1 Tax=Pseudomonas knackmussii (strain DSM 6978 / CCUG 54928 / LMG 23759 / B13) TaxID=1301098 RepID=A0A024HEK4_PSEKB|nr:OprD family porin [Pseudomonas knackmussii]CDF82898.1 porin [Pseudomonas knackmussii B13]